MKKLLRTFRLLWNIKRKEREAMIQRFEILEHFLRCVQDAKQLDQFDSKCDLLLKKWDYHNDRYGVMMIRRFNKERKLCISESELHLLAEKEGEFILKQHGLI